MNISTEDLVAALRSLKLQTGSIDCSGCGREHNCSTSGCALIREAADQLERLNDFSNSQIAQALGRADETVRRYLMADGLREPKLRRAWTDEERRTARALMAQGVKRWI